MGEFKELANAIMEEVIKRNPEFKDYELSFVPIEDKEVIEDGKNV